MPAASRVMNGITRASRATLQRSSRTGFHNPAVRMSGPQSQPKLQAILRMKLYGAGYGRSKIPEPWLLSFGVRGRRVKINFEFDRPPGQVGRDVEAVRAVHVVRASQFDPIRSGSDPDGGDGIDAVENKIDALAWPASRGVVAGSSTVA